MASESPVTMKTNARAEGHLIVLFDGECNLCTFTVKFILRRDHKDRFRFASLQTDVGLELARRHRISVAGLASVILLEGDRAFTRSTAALRILRNLSAGYALLYPLVLVPRFLRDTLYDFIARNRYRWFGKRDACMVPSPEVRGKFLDIRQAD